MMILRFLFSAAAFVAATYSLSAYSSPDKIIPEPVEYSVSEGFHNLKGDGSDIKVYLSDAEFASKIKDLPSFAQEEAYRLVVGRKGVRIYAKTEEGAFRAAQCLEMMRLIDRDIQFCDIFDYPRFQHRGVMLDEYINSLDY